MILALRGLGTAPHEQDRLQAQTARNDSFVLGCDTA